MNREQKVEYRQPETAEEREGVAAACALGLRLTISTLIDDMENGAATAFNAWPERLYVLGTDGRIAYKGGKGPYGFDPEELDGFLKTYAATRREP